MFEAVAHALLTVIILSVERESCPHIHFSMTSLCLLDNKNTINHLLQFLIVQNVDTSVPLRPKSLIRTLIVRKSAGGPISTEAKTHLFQPELVMPFICPLDLQSVSLCWTGELSRVYLIIAGIDSSGFLTVNLIL